MPRDPSTVDYGTDISADFRIVTLPYPQGPRTLKAYDATEDFAEQAGRALLMEELVRRLITPRGTLLGDPDYGTDIRAYLNDDVDAATIGQIGGAIEAELKKDDRVLSISAAVTYAEPKLTATISVVDGAGPFKFTFELTPSTLKVLGVS